MAWYRIVILCVVATGCVPQCDKQNGGCGAHAVCNQGIWQTTCACAAGYVGDGQSCSDVDECVFGRSDGTPACAAHATCFNTPGSFRCSCDAPHWTHFADRCIPADCDTEHGGCDEHAGCTDTGGSVACACEAPYVGDGYTCETCHEVACSACNECGGCSAGVGDSCTGACNAVAPDAPGVWSCAACNDCGDCAFGLTDFCGDNCSVPVPDEIGPLDCDACNNCGVCTPGFTDRCGYGCDAVPPDDEPVCG